MFKIDRENSLLAGFRFRHMSETSGYQQIKEYICCNYMDANSLIWGNQFSGSFKFRVNMILFEIELLKIRNKYRLVHYLYPEKHMLFSIPQNGTTKYVITMHLPFLKESKLSILRNKSFKSIFKSLWRKRQIQLIRRSDGIIVMSSEEAKIVSEYFPDKKVKFIPHGISPKLYIRNILPVQDEFLDIVVIGKNFRNDSFIVKLVAYGFEKNKKWKFHFVGISEFLRNEIEKYNNAKVYDYLDSDEYIELLYKMDVHFLAVTYASANNALLEATATGVPSVCTKISGIYDYSVSTTTVYSDFEEAVTVLENFEMLTAYEYAELRIKTMKDIEKFSWEKIAKETENFYKEIIGEN